LAYDLIGRDFSEISVSAKEDDLVWVTVRFAATVGGDKNDILTLRAIAESVKPEETDNQN
jgi:hypothetical protein